MANVKNIKELTFRSLVEAINEKWGHTYEPIKEEPNQKAYTLEEYELSLTDEK